MARELRLVRTPPEAALSGPAGAERRDELAELLPMVVAGDALALRTFLLSVLPQVLRVVRRVLGAHHPEVDDVAQESASNVLDALPRYRGECTVLHFVCRVAVNTAMNLRRRQAAQKRAWLREDGQELEALPNERSLPEADAMARRSAQAVRVLLDTLPIEQAEALALHVVLGHTVPEIAAACGAPLETVRSRLRLAKLAFRSRAADDSELRELLEEP